MPAKSKKVVTAQANLSRPLPAAKSSQLTANSANVAKSNEPDSRQARLSTNTTSPTSPPHLEQTESASLNTDRDNAPTVNRKKQKRREKEAAKRAAEQNLSNGFPTSEHHVQNGHTSFPHQGRGPPKGYFTEENDYVDPDFADEAVEVDDAFYSGPEDPAYSQDPILQNGYQHTALPSNPATHGKKKKKSGKGNNYSEVAQNHGTSSSTSLTRAPAPHSRSHPAPPPPLSNAALRATHKITDRIWNTSTQAERENIKQFWLELGEEERRSLVKVEKEAVLRKMKEQQKHSCSCTVCGRKRTAIEEELEVLYDAYYEELEQFANHNHGMPNGPPIMAPPRTYDHVRSPPPMAGSYPTRGRVQETGDEDDDLDEDEEYDEEDEPFSDEEVEDLPRPPPDFFTFGNSLTVKDGILTVADDLLKNDGKHFIDMMEQLAERRMQREEETHYPSAALAHQNFHQGHNHPPLDEDDDYDDDEDDEDYDSQDEDEFEGDEMDAMTEEQRMEEGRRMFQIFAARMFEQRVLTAYREKVAQERQRKLIEELDEENRLDTQREAKKAKEAAKRKEKKRLQKQAKEEEKAKKEAEKAALEAAAREVEEKKLEEQRQRKDEQRKKREAEKKASEEERARKEAEKLRKAQEERERQAELERKQRETKEREKKKREDARKKEREERETREREAKERKLKEEKERRAKEEQAKKEKEAAEKTEKETRDRVRQEQAAKRPLVAVPPGLHPPSHPSILQSPHFQVATPIIPPKVPTPAARQRQLSQQGQHSRGSSPRSLQANTETSHSSASPATVAVPQTPVQANVPVRAQGQPPVLHHPQPSAPLSPLSNQGRAGPPSYGFNGMPGLGMAGPPTSGPGMIPGMMPHMPLYQGPPMGGQHRSFGPPNGIPYPPGIHNVRQFPPNSQQMPFHSQAPMQTPILAQQVPASKPPQPHSRQPSGSQADSNPQPAPISRPAPIARPSSATPDKQKRKSTEPDVDKLATQLGSKALLDDSDIPLSANIEPMNVVGAGVPGSGRAPFPSFPESRSDGFNFSSQNWNAYTSNLAGHPSWGAPAPTSQPGGGWPAPSQPSGNAFGVIGGGVQGMSRSHAPRPVIIRRLLAEACKQLSAAPGSAPDGFHPVQTVLRQVAPKDASISLNDLLDICDTEGNAQNGGGSFEVRNDSQRGQLVKFEADSGSSWTGTAGDIGSPMVGQSQPANFGHVFGAPGKGF